MQYTWEDIYKGKMYEDDTVLVLNKPSGISVVGDAAQYDIVTLAIAHNIRLHPAHRIDKETSGSILFAKNPQMHAQLTRQFNKHQVSKEYLAVVANNILPEKSIIDLPLSLGRKNHVRVAGKREDIIYDKKQQRWFLPEEKVIQDKKNFPSTTRITRLQSNTTSTLLSVTPITGRRHQIRVHLAWIGHPIIGDPLFEKPQSRLLLHAWKISFSLSGQQITLEAKPPQEFITNY